MRAWGVLPNATAARNLHAPARTRGLFPMGSRGARSPVRTLRSLPHVFAPQGVGKLLGALVNYLVIARGSTYVAGGIPLDGAWRFALAFGVSAACAADARRVVWWGAVGARGRASGQCSA